MAARVAAMVAVVAVVAMVVAMAVAMAARGLVARVLGLAVRPRRNRPATRG